MGNHRNTLYKVLNTPNNKGRYGIGRATTFNDTIGQADIVLEKGHVATSLKYDNIDVRTVVGVVAMVNGSSNPRAKDMIKADAGGMPDAILDIWKRALNTGAIHGTAPSPCPAQPNTAITATS